MEAMSLPARRDWNWVRSWGLTKKGGRTRRHVSAGNSRDLSGLAACIVALPLREQRKNEAMDDTTVGKRGDHSQVGT
jgi:hypothetical protein